MNDRKEYPIAMMVMVVVIVLCIWAWLYGQSLTDDHAIQRLIASATAVAAVGGISAFLVLVAYTIETRRLRKASDKQLRLSKEQFEEGMKPVVLLEFDLGGHVNQQPRCLIMFRFINIGIGPAFDVKVDPIEGKASYILSVDGVPLIQSKEPKLTNCSYRQDVPQGQSGDEFTLADQFALMRFPHGTPVRVSCRGLSGKQYYSHHLIRLSDNYKKWSIEFKSID